MGAPRVTRDRAGANLGIRGKDHAQERGLAGALIIGRSALILTLKRLIQRIGPTDATVLIVGERGTGKELVADALHDLSRRREGPYLKLDCGTLPRELLPSEPLWP